MRVGVLQGRLSEPVNKKMQEFPSNTWKSEFNVLNSIGLSGIEWIITPNNNLNNPFFIESNLPLNVLSVCVDTMVNNSFYKNEFMNQTLVPVLDKMAKLNLNKIVIPLLEDSSVENEYIRYEFLKNIIPISEKYPSIDFCFEFECNKEIVIDVVNKKDNFFITYDTGNFTSTYKEKIDHKELIEYFGSKIKNVHFKDRTFNGETKHLGLGDTDFKTIIDSLKNINYTDNIILQLARGVNGDEINYIKNTYKKIKTLL
jgi:L-ribulose-5-phosphate 3-epimerase